MAKTQVGDNFTSQAVFNVTESGSNTLTFEKLETGLSVYDKIGWVIQRIDWKFNIGSFALMNTSGDFLTAALTITNTLSTLGDENPAVLDIVKFGRHDIGTAASGLIINPLFVHDYSTLSGGGILTLPNPLYVGVVGYGLSGPASIIARLFFKAIELSDTDYFNLVQARQLLIST